MPLALDAIVLEVPDVAAARAFFTRVFGVVATDIRDGVRLDLHGTGTLDLVPGHARAGYGDVVVSYVVTQPSDVERIVAEAEAAGATVLKGPKKSMFAGFFAVFQAPDGSVWKLATASRKNTRDGVGVVRPESTVVLLGTSDPKASKGFYAALGMKVDKDYGSKYLDFHAVTGGATLGLMTTAAVAKDAGVDPGSGTRPTGFAHESPSREGVDAILARAVSEGGAIVSPAEERDDGYVGTFADPDGFVWRVTSA